MYVEKVLFENEFAYL